MQVSSDSSLSAGANSVIAKKNAWNCGIPKILYRPATVGKTWCSIGEAPCRSHHSTSRYSAVFVHAMYCTASVWHSDLPPRIDGTRNRLGERSVPQTRNSSIQTTHAVASLIRQSRRLQYASSFPVLQAAGLARMLRYRLQMRVS